MVVQESSFTTAREHTWHNAEFVEAGPSAVSVVLVADAPGIVVYAQLASGPVAVAKSTERMGRVEELHKQKALSTPSSGSASCREHDGAGAVIAADDVVLPVPWYVALGLKVPKSVIQKGGIPPAGVLLQGSVSRTTRD